MPYKGKEMSMSEAFTSIPHSDDISRQLRLKIEEEELLHAARLNSTLSQGQAEPVRIRFLHHHRKERNQEQ